MRSGSTRSAAPTAPRSSAYFDHRFPLAAGTAEATGFALTDDLLAAQHYRLVSWKRGNDEVNYRRFFDVDTLVGLRVEDPDVFAATHAVLLRLHDEGLVDGFRIDHVDGLVDPRGYLARLAGAAAGAGDPPWVVVEKILLGDEELAADWACAGTTGYDALWRIGGVFVDPAGAQRLRAGFAAVTGEGQSWAEVEQESRRLVLNALLGAEVDRLAALALAVTEEDPAVGASEPSHRGLAEAIVELLVAMPVYRLYVVPGEAADAGVAASWDALVATPEERVPHRASELALVRSLALGGLRAEPPQGRVRRAVPADLRACGGQGRRGHRRLSLGAGELAQRGGLGPRPARGSSGRCSTPGLPIASAAGPPR